MPSNSVAQLARAHEAAVAAVPPLEAREAAFQNECDALGPTIAALTARMAKAEARGADVSALQAERRAAEDRRTDLIGTLTPGGALSDALRDARATVVLAEKALREAQLAADEPAVIAAGQALAAEFRAVLNAFAPKGAAWIASLTALDRLDAEVWYAKGHRFRSLRASDRVFKATGLLTQQMQAMTQWAAGHPLAPDAPPVRRDPRPEDARLRRAGVIFP